MVAYIKYIGFKGWDAMLQLYRLLVRLHLAVLCAVVVVML